MLIITGGKVFKDGKWLCGYDVLVENNKIHDIVPSGECTDGEVIDAKGLYVCPGFIDIHIHGALRHDVADGTMEAIETMAKFVSQHGTTSFLPTNMTTSMSNTQRTMDAIAKAMKKDIKGAEIMGVHLEGPFLNPLKKGAQEEEHILKPSVKTYKELVGSHEDIVKHITIAPEMEGVKELVDYLVDRHVSISVGHTNCTYSRCMEAFSWGIHHSTHFYNAMTGLNHREPGAVGAILDNDDVTLELISDLIHVHPAALRLAYRVKGAQKIALITDAMPAAGLGDGEYTLGGQKVFVKDGAARIKEGNLAGSVLTLDKALVNMVDIGVPLEDVLTMLTHTPASIIGVDDHKGLIDRGYDADIVLLDRNLSVVETIVQGKKVFSNR
jgi:N-acetylglucosamine-6-phosphate deacetylase